MWYISTYKQWLKTRCMWWLSWCSIFCKGIEGGLIMSGDISLKNEPIIFYSDQMTASKVILLKHKGIKFSLYHKVIKKIDNLK